MKGVLAAAVLGASFFVAPNTQASHSTFDPSLLIEDAAWVNTNSMGVADIQKFMDDRNSVLRNYTVPLDAVSCDPDGQPGVGRTAAEHIHFEANYYGISPRALLATLRKEQGFFSSQDPSSFSLGSDYAIKWATGYGVYSGSPYMNCGSSPDPTYPYVGGFGRQVAFAAATFKNNYNKLASGDCIVVGVEGACRKAGESFQMQTYSSDAASRTTIDPKSKATMVLYRYTPYVYNGNHNFNSILREWGWFTSYTHVFSSQNSYPTLAPGMSYKLSVQLRNTGETTWQQGTVNLGTDRPRDRIPGFIREGGSPSGWLKGNRVEMREASVAPGNTGHFDFWYTVPDNMVPGTYREYFRLVADGVQWMEDYGIYWDVKVISKAEAYRAQWVSQEPNQITLARGEKHQFEVKFKNTGIATWKKGTVNLGTDRDRDRIPGFIREGGNPSGWPNHDRIEMVEASVPPGGVGTFRFWYTVTSDKAPGVYKEYFRPVADFITWMDDYGVYFEITVP